MSLLVCFLGLEISNDCHKGLDLLYERGIFDPQQPLGLIRRSLGRGGKRFHLCCAKLLDLVLECLDLSLFRTELCLQFPNFFQRMAPGFSSTFCQANVQRSKLGFGLLNTRPARACISACAKIVYVDSCTCPHKSKRAHTHARAHAVRARPHTNGPPTPGEEKHTLSCAHSQPFELPLP
jgi:hypothetical protein